MAVLVLLPVLVYGLPTLFGHPVAPGDDTTQNFPLRVLVGREIASGHLPLYDAYAWSGSALLAGWNAGAAYPFTWLYAILSGAAAWTLGLIVTWVTAGTGLFAFLRAQRLRPLPAFLGALSFALAGAMSAQVTHFGLVAGMSWVPLALLAVMRLSESSRTDHCCSPVDGLPPQTRPTRGHLRWIALLAVSVGLIILAGEPRAIVDGCIIIGIYAVWQVGRLGLFRFSRGSSRRRALHASLLIAGGCLLGAALGAVQWLPGLDAVSSSQRGTGTTGLFAVGSLPPKWLALTLVPDLLGGSGSLGQPSFFGSYNLTEITNYVGVLPLVAAFALLGRALSGGSGGSSPRAGTRREAPDTMAVSAIGRAPAYLVWHVTGLVGVLLALGGNSPLAEVLYRLPLFGTQRLQSRNILLLDLALAILLAYWLDKPFPERSGSRAGALSGVTSRVTSGVLSRVRRPSLETLTGLLPPLAILVVVALGLTWGAGLLDWLGIPAATSAAEIGPLRPWLIPSAVLAAGAAALLLFGPRLSRKRWSRACTAFVVVDIVAFTVLAVLKVGTVASAAMSSALAPSSPPSAGVASPGAASAGAALTARVSSTAPVSSMSPVSAPARPVTALGYPGRFAIYDPGMEDTNDLTVLGPPNSNDITSVGMPSVQGYSSIVDGTYAAATGSHQASGDGQNVLSPAAIGDGTLDALDTSVLLTLPQSLTTSAPSLPPAMPSAASSAPGPGQRKIGAGQEATWYLGQSATVSRVVAPDAHARADAAAGTEIGLTTPDGYTQWFRARASGPELEITVPRAMTATTILARGSQRTRSLTLGAPSAGLADGHALTANGPLQDALVPPRWDMAGFDGGFAVFSDRLAAAPLTVEPLPGHGASAGRYSETLPASALTASVQPALTQDDTSTSADVTAATVESAHGVRLVRAVSAIPGWSATWHPRNGQPVPLTVQRDGVVQAVDVPAGQGTVTWHYMTPRFPAGLAISVAAALFTLGLVVMGRRPRPAVQPVPRHELETQPA